MRIAILPLDERPVNTRLPSMVAAIAGAEVVLPPADLLPWIRQPGDVAGLTDWLGSVAGTADALVVSLDMLGYGGLIASRTSTDPLDAVVGRLGTLDGIRRAHPGLWIGGLTTVLRMPDSYQAIEQPDDWSRYGAELRQLEAALHGRFLSESQESEPHGLSAGEAAVPPEVRGEFLRRRLRNHTVDLYAIGLAAAGVLRPLVLADTGAGTETDDTARRSAGSLERRWLSGWIDALRSGDPDAADDPDRTPAWCCPDADDAATVLTAAALAARLDTRPRIAAVFGDERSGSRITPDESVPVAETVRRQILAAGAVPTTEPDQADAVLLVHPPARDGGDDSPDEDVEAVLDLIGRQHPSAILGLADVRHQDGSDPGLVDGLVERELVSRLSAYGGWNTTGNAIGSVAAALVAVVAGRELGTHDPVAERRLLLHRLVEDYGYQAVVRRRIGGRQQFADYLFRPFEEPAGLVAYLAECVPQLESVLVGFDQEWRLVDVQLPWNRTFEVDFHLTPP